jgi:hypothetical protein
MANEYLENISYGFYGPRLDPVQRMQRLYGGGFKDAALLVVAYSVMMGESGGYLKAFHHNVEREEDGTIKRFVVDGKTYMKVKSTDLGFIQKNTPHSPARMVEMTEEASLAFVDELFEKNPELANGYESAEIAWQMYNTVVGGKKREFTPWIAYTNKNYKKSLAHASVSLGKWAANKFINDPEYVIKNPNR